MNQGSGDPLPIIHLALAAGLFVFAAVLLVFLGPGEAVDGTALRWVWLGLAFVAVLAPGIIRGRVAVPGADDQTRRAGAITIWALAEGQALVGLVFYAIAGDAVPAVVGMLVFLFLWWRYRPSGLRG